MSIFRYRIQDGGVQLTRHEAKSYAEACREALQVFGDVISDIRHKHPDHWTNLTLELSDERGLVLLNLEFNAVESAAVRKCSPTD